MGADETMSIRGEELIHWLNQFAPPRLAVENDRIGLQVGSASASVEGILVTLDVTEEVVDEAIASGANWIIGHHAIIFQPLKQIRTDFPSGRVLQKCIKHDLQVFIAHTNLDATVDGVNDVLAEKLGLKATRTFLTHGQDHWKKLVVFVPETHSIIVEQALGNAGAGCIGNYSHCTFQTAGTGTFFPLEGTQPFIGEQGKLERANEIRIETVIPESKQLEIIHAMKQVHPYEEVAYDVYPLDLPGEPIGMGKVGTLAQRTSLKKFANQVKQAYKLSHVRFVGHPDRQVQKVAILGGSGSRYIREAIRQRADVYLTGDIDFHTAQDALAAGLSLIDPGHHVEFVAMQRVVDRLIQHFDRRVPIQLSQVDTNPFSFC